MPDHDVILRARDAMTVWLAGDVPADLLQVREDLLHVIADIQYACENIRRENIPPLSPAHSAAGRLGRGWKGTWPGFPVRTDCYRQGDGTLISMSTICMEHGVIRNWGGCEPTTEEYSALLRQHRQVPHRPR